MSTSGRMTFRFNTEPDKTGVNPEMAGQKSGEEPEPVWEHEIKELESLWDEDFSYSGIPADEAGHTGGIFREMEQTGSQRVPAAPGSYEGVYHSRRPSHWWKLALSVAGALGTGLLLGYAALSYFGQTTDIPDNGAAGSAMIQSGTESGDQPVAGDTGLPSGETLSEAGGRIPVDVPAQSYYMLQYGVFSTETGAAQAQQELQSAGLASGADPEGGNRVYAGMSPDREQAKLLSGGLKNQGIELYVREVTLPSVQQAAFAGNAETVNEYFTASGELLNELSGISAALLGGATATADLDNVSDLHMRWTESVKALIPGLSTEAQSECALLEKAVSRGIAALNEYNKNAAQGLLWEVQEAMMGFLAGQRELVAELI